MNWFRNERVLQQINQNTQKFFENSLSVIFWENKNEFVPINGFRWTADDTNWFHFRSLNRFVWDLVTKVQLDFQNWTGLSRHWIIWKYFYVRICFLCPKVRPITNFKIFLRLLMNLLIDWFISKPVHLRSFLCLVPFSAYPKILVYQFTCKFG